MLSTIPTYNLMVVLKETGLKADVLRAWEKRYGLPNPQRSSGGHRLYSDFDIAVIKWLQDRMEEGLSISRAVKLWNDFLAAGRMPLEEIWPSRTASHLNDNLITPVDLAALRQNWLDACLKFDTNRAEGLLNQAFAWFPIERVVDELLGTGLSVIGEQWYLGEISVQQEHFASAMAIRRVQTLITSAPLPNRAQTVVIGCPPGERHIFTALVLNLLLLHKGLHVVFLGADLPLDQLGASMDSIRPNLVVYVAQQLTTASALVDISGDLQARGYQVAFGGRVFNLHPEIRSRIPAVFLGENLPEALSMVEQLIVAPSGQQSTKIIDNPLNDLASRFKQERVNIDQTLSVKLLSPEFSTEKIEEVNAYTGGRLISALELGNIHFMNWEMDWLKGLILNRNAAEDQLRDYLVAYGDAVALHLGQENNPISLWMKEYVSGME